MKPLSSLRRRPPSRRPPTKFVIFAEGANTEPDYLDSLQEIYEKTIIEIHTKPASGPPHTITAKAIAFAKAKRRAARGRKSIDSFEENDQVWVMFDRDTHDKVSESLHTCEAHNIGVAYSNPCFELWLILHFQDYDKPSDHHQVQKDFEALCPAYSAKGSKMARCIDFIDQLPTAEGRALKMIERRKKERAEYQAPWTTVHHLTTAIKKAAS